MWNQGSKKGNDCSNAGKDHLSEGDFSRIKTMMGSWLGIQRTYFRLFSFLSEAQFLSRKWEYHNGKWKVENGKLKVESWKWKVESWKWKVINVNFFINVFMFFISSVIPLMILRCLQVVLSILLNLCVLNWNFFHPGNRYLLKALTNILFRWLLSMQYSFYW